MISLGLSGHVCLKIAQEPRHLARGRGNRRRRVGHGFKHDESFANEIQSPLDLAMPKTPADPLDGIGEAGACLAIVLL